jgi:hypothetical protein
VSGNVFVTKFGQNIALNNKSKLTCFRASILNFGYNVAVAWGTQIEVKEEAGDNSNLKGL